MRVGMVLLACGVLAGAFGGTAGAAGSSAPAPYFAAMFKVRANSHTFGQTPSWARNGDVLSQEDDESGIQQVYRSKLDGSHKRCLTCGRVKGSNGFAEERPQGDWIMFSSWADQAQHFGGPGLGGFGSDLYVMRKNGTDPVWLTATTDPNHGADYRAAGGVPYDNYHSYWSPDGRHIAWTRAEAYPLSEGGERWEMMLADFVVPKTGTPHLSNVRVVGPAFGVYETQHWAPDGSGFLFTAFGPRASPFQNRSSGLDAPGAVLHASLRSGRIAEPPTRHPDQRQHADVRGAGGLHAGHGRRHLHEQPSRADRLLV